MKGDVIHRFGEVVTLLLFLIPFLDSPYPDDYDGLRNPIAAALVTALVLRVIISAARRREFSYRIDPTLTAMAIFFVVHILSLSKAVNVWESILPLIRLSVGIGLYAFLVSGYLSRTFVLKIGLPVMAVAAGVVSLLGLLQIDGIDLFGRNTHGQPVATLGNTNYVGAFLAMMVPFAVSMLFVSGGWLKRGLILFMTTFMVIHLVGSGSRGGWLGTAAGLLVLAAACLLIRHPTVAFSRAKVFGLVVLVGAGVLFAGWAMRDTEFVKRLGTIVDPSYPSNQVRVETWKSALSMGKGEPLLGVGPGNFAIRFPPHRSGTEFLLSHQGGERFRGVEDPHNTFLATFCETGLLGLLSFLLILYVSFRRWFYFMKAAPDRDHILILAGLFSAVAGFLVSGMFNSLMLFTTHAMVFWILLGWIELLGNQKPRFRKLYATDWIMACGISCLLIGGFMVFLTGRSFAAGLERHEGVRLAKAGHLVQAVERLEQSLSLDYNNWRSHFSMGHALYLSGKFKDAEAQWMESLRLHPNNVLALQGLARIALEGGNKEMALKFITRAIEIAPAYHDLHHDLGELFEKWGQPEEARRAFDHAARLKEGKLD